MIDAGAAVVMPGIVDTHVHINEPGRTEWEGFETATRAAAAGGVTTLVDMPLNSIPATTTVEALDTKRRAAEGRCHVDVGFWGGVVPGNRHELEPLAHAGVLGFKCFLSPVWRRRISAVGEYDLRSAMLILAKAGLPMLAHANGRRCSSRQIRAKDRRHYKTWLNTRPPEAEHAAIDLMLQLSARTGARAHIVHLASADALPAITESRRRRREGDGGNLSALPRVLRRRDPDRRHRLEVRAADSRARPSRTIVAGALRDGEIDLVATDHSPAPPALKHLDDGDFIAAWGGIASLQLALPVMWTGARQRGIPFERLAQWMCAAPAKLAGLGERKGAIATGHDADFGDRRSRSRVHRRRISPVSSPCHHAI